MRTITLTQEFMDYVDTNELYDVLDEVVYNYSLAAIDDAAGMLQEAAPVNRQMQCLQQLKRLIKQCK